MRKMFVTATAALVLSAGVALAAPATPVFNTPVKLGEGSTNYELNKRMVFNGTTIYAGFDGNDGTVRVVKSANGGTTWGLSKVLQRTDATYMVDGASLRLAISNDPLYIGQKIVHAVWHATDISAGWPYGNVVYYSYLASRPNQTGWSTPVKIDIGATDGGGTSLAVTASGAIHVLFNNKYTTAASPDSPFSYPVSLPEPSDGETYMVMDSSNNLYVAYVIGPCQFLRMTKKAASSTNWTTPVTVFSITSSGLSRNLDLVVLNPTTYYIGIYQILSSGLGEADLLVSTNSGGSWTKRTVITNTPDGDNMVNVAVSATKIISFASEVYDTTGKATVKVWRSSDNGATWSAPATIQGQRLPNMNLDSAGKLNIMVSDEVNYNDWAQGTNLLWIKEK